MEKVVDDELRENNKTPNKLMFYIYQLRPLEAKGPGDWKHWKKG